MSETTTSVSNGQRTLLIVVTLLFGVLSTIALATDGIAGFGDAITFSWASVQIYVDLVLAIALIAVWIHRDATRRARNPWPWIALGIIAGMFGPLLYLIARGDD